MNTMDKLKYHQKSIDLVGKFAKFSEDLIKKVLEKEKSLGLKLPESIKEFYSIKGLINRLGFACDNFPTPLEDLCLDENGLMEVMVENQAVYIWAIDPKRGEDPPVLITEDRKDWEPYANSFSEFVLAEMFYYLEDDFPELEGSSEKITEQQLDCLRKKFIQSTTTFIYPGKVSYRYINSDKTGLITVHDEQYWTFLGESEENLLEITLKSLECVDTLKFSLPDVSKEEEIDDIEKNVLEQLPKYYTLKKDEKSFFYHKL